MELCVLSLVCILLIRFECFLFHVSFLKFLEAENDALCFVVHKNYYFPLSQNVEGDFGSLSHTSLGLLQVSCFENLRSCKALSSPGTDLWFTPTPLSFMLVLPLLCLFDYVAAWLYLEVIQIRLSLTGLYITPSWYFPFVLPLLWDPEFVMDLCFVSRGIRFVH